ncbi:hypothetical protein [Natrialba chahannaoensis]|nr:hypothetical protein [Natrialba chahannaoensis]
MSATIITPPERSSRASKSTPGTPDASRMLTTPLIEAMMTAIGARIIAPSRKPKAAFPRCSENSALTSSPLEIVATSGKPKPVSNIATTV